MHILDLTVVDELDEVDVEIPGQTSGLANAKG
jgi:hypothetical protein